MTIACSPPDGDLGVALRLSTYLDCQARALGENGFQAIAGGPVSAGLLSALVTIFVALIGYRLILGQTPALRDGIGWAVRLGIVLAFATGWPAFQTLVYRVAVDGPNEFAAVLLPAAGLPAEELDGRVQQAYDTIRLGSANQPIAQAQQPTPAPTGTPGGQPTPLQGTAASVFGQPPLPQTASWFAITTLGVVGALRLAVGFLLALGPIAIMALLFDATFGLFSGWVRALAGGALALVAAIIVTALDVVMVEGELAHLQTAELGVSVIDPQGLTTVVLAFALIMIVALWAAARMASAFRLPLPTRWPEVQPASVTAASRLLPGTASVQEGVASRALSGSRTAQARVQTVADALATSLRREQVAAAAGGDPARRAVPLDRRVMQDVNIPPSRLGASGRRLTGRRTRSATRRDEGA